MAGCSWVKYFWPPPDDDNTFGSAPEPPTVSNVSHSTLNYWTFYIILPFAKPTVARPKVAKESGGGDGPYPIYIIAFWHQPRAGTESRLARELIFARLNFPHFSFISLPNTSFSRSLAPSSYEFSRAVYMEMCSYLPHLGFLQCCHGSWMLYCSTYLRTN